MITALTVSDLLNRRAQGPVVRMAATCAKNSVAHAAVRSRYLCVLFLLSSAEAGLALENKSLERERFLFVCESTALQVWDDHGQREIKLPVGCLMRRIPSSAPQVVSDYVVFAETLDAASYNRGWLDSNAFIAPFSSPPGQLSRRVVEFDTGEFPEQISRSGPEIVALWKRVQKRIHENAASGNFEPAPYILRGRLWSAVYNRDKALQDYTVASRVAIQSAKNDLEAVASLKKLKTLFARIKPISPVPLPVPLSHQLTSETYATGYHAYWEGDFGRALEAFNVAIEVNPHEPIHWYYRALTWKRRNEQERAEQDAHAGAFWEHQSALAKRDGGAIFSLSYIGSQLERVQGSERLWLEAFRRSAKPRPSSLSIPPLPLESAARALR